MYADNFVEKMRAGGIEVQRDAIELLEFACRNQLRAGLVAEEADIARLIDGLTPDIVSAYKFKFGSLPLTFGRAVKLLADVAERWVELRGTLAQA